MTELVASLWQSKTLEEGALADLLKKARTWLPSKDILILGSFLIILQILDGLLTGIGMYHFGTRAEGNMFLRVAMESIGYIPALVLAKSLAIGIILFLCHLAKTVKWLPMAMKAVILIYLGAAVIPWTAIIVTRVL